MAEQRKPSDIDTLARIHDLVAEEKELRARLQHHDISESDERERLRSIGHACLKTPLLEKEFHDPASTLWWNCGASSCAVHCYAHTAAVYSTENW